jgi:HAD superfamily hydrolase (TIGR01549 family)
MMRKLMVYYIKHMNELDDLYALYKYRKIHNNVDNSNLTKNDIIYKLKMDGYTEIDKVVTRWIEQEPLSIIEKYRYREITEFIKQQHDNNKKIYIYSDYNSEEKLKQLELENSITAIFSSESIGEQKPSQKAMKHILKEIDANIYDIIYIGDRDDKDRRSAELVNIDYIDIKEFRKIIGRGK